MKLSIVAVATVFALSSPAFAQDHLNGSTLGQSQPGYNAGVPYPNPAAVDDPEPAAPEPERAAPVDASSAKVQGAATPKPRKKTSKSAKKAVAAKDKVTVTPTNSPSPGAASPH